MALLADLDEAACFGMYKICTVPEQAVEWGIARKWSCDLGEKVCPSPAPTWTIPHLKHEQPNEVTKVLNSYMGKQYETQYVRVGQADSELVG